MEQLPEPSVASLVSVATEQLVLHIYQTDAQNGWDALSERAINLMGGTDEVISYLACLVIYLTDSDIANIFLYRETDSHHDLVEAVRRWLFEQLKVADLDRLAPLAQNGLTNDELYHLATFRTLTTG